MSIIDDLKRLERFGSENSVAVEKLKRAAVAVADLIVNLLPPLDELPRGYSIAKAPDGHLWLRQPPYRGGEVLNLHPSRRAVLSFARDLATGWLGELANMLATDEQAVTVLEAAEVALKRDGTLSTP